MTFVQILKIDTHIYKSTSQTTQTAALLKTYFVYVYYTKFVRSWHFKQHAKHTNYHQFEPEQTQSINLLKSHAMLHLYNIL